MHTIILRSHVRDKKEFGRLIREDYLLRLKELPGFRGYYGIDGDGDTWASIFVIETPEEAEVVGERVRGYVREQPLAELIVSGPELIVTGETVIAEMVEREHEERRAA
jgi:hypothetical protein